MIRRPGARRSRVASAVAAPAAFTPASLTGLYAWWGRPPLGIAYGVNPAVAGWTNQEGTAARDLAQATAVNQPAVDATAFNGQPSVKGDGSNDNLQSGVISLTDCTIFIPCRPTSLASAQFLMGLDSATTSGVGINATTGTVIFRGSATVINGAGTVAANTNNVIIAKRSGSNAAVAANRGAFTTGTFGDTFNKFWLFSRVSGALPSSAYIGDPVVYNRELTAGEITQVLDYYTAYWGTP